MGRRFLPWVFATVLICAVSTVASIVAGIVVHPAGSSICRLAELLALLAAVGFVLTRGRDATFGARVGWGWLATGVLVHGLSLAAADTGVLRGEAAVVSAAAGALFVLGALFAFERGSGGAKAWSAVWLEILAAAAVVLALGWIIIEVVTPELVFATTDAKLTALFGGVLFVLAGCLAAACTMSSTGRSRVAFALVGGWSATAAVTVTWTAVATVLQFEPGPAARLISAAGLCLPVAAAEISRNHDAPLADVGERLGRAHRGLLSTIVVIALFVFLGAWSIGVLTETAAWIAVLGLPAAMARMVLTATENHGLAAELQRELERARQRNLELQDARAAAEIAREAQAAFLGRTSHELRTPLHAIVGFAELLESEDLSGEGHARLGQIRMSGRHLLELVEDLLDLNQVETGAVTLKRKAVGLRTLVVEAAGQVSALADQVGGRVAVVRGDWEDVAVHTDARRVRQVLTNLLTNALRHAGGQVTVSVEATPWMVTFHVADGGPGMDAATLDRVFDPFERNGLEYHGVPGVGLGLPIARTLAEALGGRLTAESIVGVGSRFSLVLPSLAWPDDADEAPAIDLARTA